MKKLTGHDIITKYLKYIGSFSKGRLQVHQKKIMVADKSLIDLVYFGLVK